MGKVIPGGPGEVYFQEVKPGDLKKLAGSSNGNPSVGGGARDLRVRPAAVYGELLQPFFPHSTDRDGISEGEVFWWTEDGEVTHARMELWRPTEARPEEARIARIGAIGGWSVDEAAYFADREEGLRWFFVLHRDTERRVWAFVLRERDLAREAELLRSQIEGQARDASPSVSIRGFVNLATGERYP